jgi:hypothetical protein
MKKVLILSKSNKNFADMKKEDIRCSSSLYKYYIGDRLARNGIAVISHLTFINGENWEKYREKLISVLKKHVFFDAVICACQRGIDRSGKKNEYYNILKKYSKKVVSICDNAYSIGISDVLYYAIPIKESEIKTEEHLTFIREKSHFVGWGADPDLCNILNKKNDKLTRVLIDHSYYADVPYKDYTNKIVDSASNYLKKGKHKNKIIFKRFISNDGIGLVSKDDNIVEVFDRSSGLNYVDACKYYSESDIFVVTHAESMGLSVIESAMAGCLILSPLGCIKKVLLNPLLHIEFDINNGIPWDRAIGMVNHRKSRNLAIKNTWENVLNNMLKDLFS